MNQFFYDLRGVGLYCDDDPLHEDCLRFSFMPLIQEELNRFAQKLILHRIRPSLNQESPPGRPGVLFFLPELQETISFHTVDEDAILVRRDMCCDNQISASRDTFAQLAEMVMEENNLQIPGAPMEAFHLYSELPFHIESTTKKSFPRPGQIMSFFPYQGSRKKTPSGMILYLIIWFLQSKGFSWKKIG